MSEEKPTVSMLDLALRKIKKSKPEASEQSESEVSSDALEQAMSDFRNATNAKEQAAAFCAALELAK